MTEAEELAVLTVLGFKELPQQYKGLTFAQVLDALREAKYPGDAADMEVLHAAILELVDAEKVEREKAEAATREAEDEHNALRDQVKALLVKVMDKTARWDVVNMLEFKTLQETLEFWR